MLIKLHSLLVLLTLILIFFRGSTCSFSPVDLDFLWAPSAPNGSNITEFTCTCFSYMDATTGRCLPSSVTSQVESMAAEFHQTPLLKQCSYKRVILGQRVVIRCPYSRNDSYWSSLGRWNNATDICIHVGPDGYGYMGDNGRPCGRSDHIILTHLNDLIIDPILTSDPGIYECIKLNKTSYSDEEVFRMGIVIDYDTALYGQLVYSSVVGASAAVGFLAIALSVHFLRVLVEYCRNQEMNKQVQWVMEFVSRQHNHHHPSARFYPSNGGLSIPPKIDEETVIAGEGPEGETEVVIVDGNETGNEHLSVRAWGPYMPVKMEQFSAIRDRASQQMEKVRARYYERAQRVRTQCGSQMDQLHQQYHSKLSKMKDYSSNRYYNIRVRYSKKRQDLQNYANMKMSLVRDNYQMQRQYLSKVMDSLAIDSCRSYAPSLIAGSEDYQASLREGDSIAAGLDLESLPIDDGTSSLCSSRRVPHMFAEEDDDSVNIDLDWGCLTPPVLPPSPGSRHKSALAEEDGVIGSAPDSPAVTKKSGKFAACLVGCHSANKSSHPRKIPPQLLRCPAFQSGMCADGKHNHFHDHKPHNIPNGSLKSKRQKETSSSPVSSNNSKPSANDNPDGEVREPLVSTDSAETYASVINSLPFADD